MLPVFFSGTWYHLSLGLPHSQPKQFSFKQMIMLFMCLSPWILLCAVSVSVISLALITQIMKRLPMCLFRVYTFSSSRQRHTLWSQLTKEEQWIEFFHSHYADKTGHRSLVKCRKMGAQWGRRGDRWERKMSSRHCLSADLLLPLPSHSIIPAFEVPLSAVIDHVQTQGWPNPNAEQPPLAGLRAFLLDEAPSQCCTTL